MDQPILDDFEDTEDISESLEVLEEVEKLEGQTKDNKPLKEYGRITCSEY